MATATGESVTSRVTPTTFEGVPHRLEVVRRWRGITFVNDSIATTPERAIAALRSYDEPLVLLAGGRDKHLPWEEWAKLAQVRARAVVAIGEGVNADNIAGCIELLKSMKWDGVLSIECEAAPGKVEQSLEWLRKQIAR